MATQQALEQRAVFVDQVVALAATVLLERRLDVLEHRGIDDRLVFAVVDLCLMPDLADVDGVGQQCVDRTLVERSSAASGSLFRRPRFVAPTATGQFLDDR